MQAGKLRHRVAIQTFTETQDTYGEPIRTWSTALTVHASIKPLRGQELLAAQEIAAETTHESRMRYNSTLTSLARLKFGSRIFDITGVVNWLERNVLLIVSCKEAL